MEINFSIALRFSARINNKTERASARYSKAFRAKASLSEALNHQPKGRCNS